MESVKQNIEYLISNWEVHEALDEMEGLAHSIEQRNKRNIAKKAVQNCRQDILAFENASIEAFGLGSGHNPLRQEHINRLHNLLTWLLNNPASEKQRPAPVRSSPRPRKEGAKAQYSGKMNNSNFAKSAEISGLVDKEEVNANNQPRRCFWLNLSFAVSMLLGAYSIGLPYWVGYGVMGGMWTIVVGFLGLFIPLLTIIEKATRKAEICTKSILIFFVGLTGFSIAASVGTTITWINSVVIKGTLVVDGMPNNGTQLQLSASGSDAIIATTSTDVSGEFLFYFSQNEIPIDADSLSPNVISTADRPLFLTRLDFAEKDNSAYRTTCKIPLDLASGSNLALYASSEKEETCCSCTATDIKGRVYVMSLDREICQADPAVHDSIIIHTPDTDFFLTTDSEGYFSFPFISDWQSQITLDVFHGEVRDRCCFTASLPGYMGVCEADSAQNVSLIIRAIPILRSGREGDNCPQYQLNR